MLELPQMTSADDQRHQFAEKSVGRHPRQPSLQEPERGPITGDDAAQVNQRTSALMDIPKHVVAAADDFRAAFARPIQSQSAKITNPRWLAIDKSLTGGNAAGCDNASVFNSNNSLVFRTFDTVGGEKLGLALQGYADGAWYGILTEQAPERRIVGRSSQLKVQLLIDASFIANYQLA
jgi:hypothetical protein